MSTYQDIYGHIKTYTDIYGHIKTYTDRRTYPQTILQTITTDYY